MSICHRLGFGIAFEIYKYKRLTKNFKIWHQEKLMFQ